LTNGGRKESNYPSYNIAKDNDEHYRIEVALAGFSSDDISIQTEKGVLTIEAKKDEAKEKATENYIHRGIAQRAFSKMFRLAEYMKVDDAQFVDGILTVFLYREIPEADKSRQITINSKAKSLPKAASADPLEERRLSAHILRGGHRFRWPPFCWPQPMRGITRPEITCLVVMTAP